MLMRTLAFLLPLVSALALAATAGAESAAQTPAKIGFALRRFTPPEPYEWRGSSTHALVTAIWYPAVADAEARPQQFGPPGSPAFLIAGPAAENAAIAPSPARLPLILLSHGTGGTAQSLAWFASALAAQGYIVAGVNHPGNNATEPYTVQGFMLWWQRAEDLSRVLDGMLADPAFGPRIDPQRIGAAGFSLGGYTMMVIAGGISSRAQLVAFCQERQGQGGSCKSPPEFPDSVSKSADLARTDPGFAAALRDSDKSYRDPRVRAVFAMAPPLAPAFTPGSLAAIRIPVAIVAGEGDPIVPVGENARRYAAAIPHAELTIFPGAVGHYTFLDLCTPAGREARPAFCVDAPGVDRAAIHQATIGLASKFFDAELR
jgi:predicted dienelactone hydrolase